MKCLRCQIFTQQELLPDGSAAAFRTLRQYPFYARFLLAGSFVAVDLDSFTGNSRARGVRSRIDDFGVGSSYGSKRFFRYILQSEPVVRQPVSVSTVDSIDLEDDEFLASLSVSNDVGAKYRQEPGAALIPRHTLGDMLTGGQLSNRAFNCLSALLSRQR